MDSSFDCRVVLLKRQTHNAAAALIDPRSALAILQLDRRVITGCIAAFDLRSLSSLSHCQRTPLPCRFPKLLITSASLRSRLLEHKILNNHNNAPECSRRRALLLHFSGWLAQTYKFCQLGNHAMLFIMHVALLSMSQRTKIALKMCCQFIIMIL